MFSNKNFNEGNSKDYYILLALVPANKSDWTLQGYHFNELFDSQVVKLSNYLPGKSGFNVDGRRLSLPLRYEKEVRNRHVMVCTEINLVFTAQFSPILRGTSIGM